MSTRFADHLLTGIVADRPAATAVPAGTLYASTDEALIYQSDGATWGNWIATAGAGVTAGAIDSEAATDGQVLTADGAGAAAWETPPVAARIMELKVIDDTTTLTTGDGKAIFCVPAAFNGLNLTAAHAFVTTVSSSGLPTVQIRNVTQAADMLTTKVTIDASEFTSYTAAAAAVIDTANDDVATGDLLAVDCDVAGTAARGLGVILTFA